MFNSKSLQQLQVIHKSVMFQNEKQIHQLTAAPVSERLEGRSDIHIQFPISLLCNVPVCFTHRDRFPALCKKHKRREYAITRFRSYFVW
jgi:hypothetical protein